MKVSDYVVQFLVEKDIRTIFMVSGGGIMHLVDSVGKNPDMRYYCNYHEQACAIAAEGYARVTGRPAVCLVTTGPGSTNALSGIAGAWVDSVPVVVISGQVRRDLIADYSRIRQVGPQEINAIDMARAVTKYATTIMEPNSIRHELERAFATAASGRPGPVWVSIPLDVQGAMIDETNLTSYVPEASAGSGDPTLVAKVVELLQQAQRPALICGNGIHLAGAAEALREFAHRTHSVALGTFGGMDLFDDSDPMFMGRFGPVGQRRANFALQNADLLLCLGASMSVSSIGFNTQGFAPRATKIMVNIDSGDFTKPNLTPDLAVLADLKWFFEEFSRQTHDEAFEKRHRWLEACAQWKLNYPVDTPDYYADKEHVNSYAFVGALSELLGPRDVVLTGSALDAASVYHSFRAQLGQRIFTNINYGAMGWDLPAAVGACLARGNQRTILVTGDGSLQFNVHELLTIGHNVLNVKIFVLNNGGYESLRATQKNFFAGRLAGSDAGSGVGNPEFAALAEAYHLRYARVGCHGEIAAKVPELLASDGPVLCELNIAYDQTRSPKTMSVRRTDGTMESRPLEDMFPFLPCEEIARNMNLFVGDASMGTTSTKES